MGASLLEMVLAIALAGMVCGAAILPTLQVLGQYHESELDLQSLSAHAIAAVRFEQVAGSIWRDPNGPPGGAPLQTAQSGRLQVGNWTLLQSSSSVQQQFQSGAATTLISPVNGFTYQYLLDTGDWTSNPTADLLDNIIALRCDWTDPNSGLPFTSLVVAPDSRFSGGVQVLPQPITSQAYLRDNYRRSLSFSLGSWP